MLTLFRARHSVRAARHRSGKIVAGGHGRTVARVRRPATIGNKTAAHVQRRITSLRYRAKNIHRQISAPGQAGRNDGLTRIDP
ncbi:hypothetical protein KZ810_05165 [Sphingomonas sp. RHCKR47]|nr:hypothetical protein [Sphingomonas citricola]